ncbi:MAG: hypothetical protein RL173_3284 [Fibrobacterota bacterium]
MDSAVAADSLKPFCAEKENRHIWKLTVSDTSLKSTDFVQFLSWVAKVNIDCRGLFALGDDDPPVLMQPPVPASRDIYSLARKDSTKPRVSIMVVAERSRVRFFTLEGWMPEIPVVSDTKGQDWVASEKNPAETRIGWHDAYGRCVVDVRGDHCTDSLWANTKYVLLGDIGRLPDTIRTDNPKDMEWVVRGPLSRDIAVAAQIHAVRTLPGTLAESRAYNHGVLGPDLSWESTQRLVVALRAAGIDFNTIEILK